MVQEYKSLVGLIFSCTMGVALESCPFLSIRSLPLANRLDVLEELSDDEKDKLIMLHRKCLSCRDYVRISH